MTGIERDNRKPSVSAVTVTFNRLEKLKHTLACFDNQTAEFDNLIVVDNCSTDGTRKFLEQWRSQESVFSKHVIFLDRNTGGSGGFYEGEKYALSLNPDWIYIADDDAYPALDMMESFFNAEGDFRNEKIAAICSVVLYPDGTINTGCRGVFSIEDNTYKLKEIPEEEYCKPYFVFNNLSYVGVFLSSNALREVGLVNKEFFIYQDDCEHSIRLSSYGKFICCPRIVVTHDESKQLDEKSIKKVLWKEYYAHRNNLYMIRIHFPKAAKKATIQKLGQIHSHKDKSMSAVDKMAVEGIKDAIWGKLGLHPVYRPGLTLDENPYLPYPKFLWQVVYWILRIRKMIIHR